MSDSIQVQSETQVTRDTIIHPINTLYCQYHNFTYEDANKFRRHMRESHGYTVEQALKLCPTPTRANRQSVPDQNNNMHTHTHIHSYHNSNMPHSQYKNIHKHTPPQLDDVCDDHEQHFVDEQSDRLVLLDLHGLTPSHPLLTNSSLYDTPFNHLL